MAIRMLKSLHCKSSDENDVVEPTSKRFFFLHQKTVSKLLLPKASPDNLLHPSPKLCRPTSRLPLLTELPRGHPSRNIVEIIFHTSWFPPLSSPATVDMIFKVHNSARAISCFEEYREMVKTMVREHDPDGRCAADGNELMRFRYLGGKSGPPPVKEMQVCTFSGSGRAHSSGGEGEGEGRRAMMVCRVVAGRVLTPQLRNGSEMELKRPQQGFHSVMGENDDLFVENPRSLLPCFIVTYTCD